MHNAEIVGHIRALWILIKDEEKSDEIVKEISLNRAKNILDQYKEVHEAAFELAMEVKKRGIILTSQQEKELKEVLDRSTNKMIVIFKYFAQLDNVPASIEQKLREVGEQIRRRDIELTPTQARELKSCRLSIEKALTKECRFGDLETLLRGRKSPDRSPDLRKHKLS
ncbi:MAG: hypothetical protein AABX38_01235 [Candidatus Micrarchaeota archaeon]